MRPAIVLETLVVFALGMSARAQDKLPVDPTGHLNEQNLGWVCDNKITRYLSSFEDHYRLTPEQIEQVRDRLEELKQDQIRYSLSAAAERAELREQSRAEVQRFLERTRSTQSRPAVDDVEALSAEIPSWSRLMAIKAEEPLFNEDRVCDEIDKLLPAEQASAGRRRFEESRRQRRQALTAGFEAEGGSRILQADDAWASYVERYCGLFALTEDQRATALSILRDVTDCRDVHIMRHRREIAALKAFSQSRASGAELTSSLQALQDQGELFAPIDRLWHEMRTRLDSIPTAQQIERARRQFPRFPATRPSDYVSGLRTPATQPSSRPT